MAVIRSPSPFLGLGHHGLRSGDARGRTVADGSVVARGLPAGAKLLPLDYLGVVWMQDGGPVSGRRGAHGQCMRLGCWLDAMAAWVARLLAFGVVWRWCGRYTRV